MERTKMKVLWLTNKYVDGLNQSVHYPHFLAAVEEAMESAGHSIYFAIFSQAMDNRIQTKKNIVFHLNHKSHINPADLAKKAAKIEADYAFTFKQAYFAEIIQVSKSQDMRRLTVPEQEFNHTDRLIQMFQFLEEVVIKHHIDVVFCDQSPEVQMEFGRAICLKHHRLFLRYDESFLSRCVFYHQLKFGKEQVVEAILDPNITRKETDKFIADYVAHRAHGYKPYQKVSVNPWYHLQKIPRFYRYPNHIKRILSKPYYFLENKVLKRFIEDRFDPNTPYFFFGFHLITESTVVQRAQPYTNQISLIESISRVLPAGFALYVREHPHYRNDFAFTFLKQLKKFPNVRLISSWIPISEVIMHARGIITYNATTGIEALMYGKPVLSFAPNIYYKFHPAVSYCSDLFTIGESLINLIHTTVNKEDTQRYIHHLFQITTPDSLSAATMLSPEVAEQKATNFVINLLKAIEYCQKHPVNTDS